MLNYGNNNFKLILPREHGAWAMLLLPYATGFLTVPWSGGAWLPVILGLIGILLLFMARAPMMYLAKRRYRRGSFGSDTRNYWISATAYAVAAALIFTVIIVLDGIQQLSQLAAIALVATSLQSWLAVTRGERSMAAELSGVCLLTLTAPLGALLAGSGDPWSREVVTLWAANASFYAASVFNVKMKVASMVERRDRFSLGDRFRIARGSLAYLFATLAGWMTLSLAALAPARAVAAFFPLAAYVAWSFATMSSSLKIKSEGFIQLAMSLGFTVIVVAVWRFN